MSNTATATTPRTLRVALAGNPNAGKTSLFNALTGLRQKVANYPGVTVEKKTGRRVHPSAYLDIIDLPGTYSLIATTPDEIVAADVLRGLRSDTQRPDALIAVIDAANLPRNLYLFSQLIELGIPVVVGLNMVDVAERRGLTLDIPALTRALGVPVVPVVGNKHRGIDALVEAVLHCPVPSIPAWPIPQSFQEELQQVSHCLATHGAAQPHLMAARRLLIDDADPQLAALSAHPNIAAALAGARQRLNASGIDPVQADIQARYHWIDGVVAACTSSRSTSRTISERVDNVLLHPVAGLLIFAAVMALLFITIFWIAGPIMDGMESAVAWLGGLITAPMSAGPLRDLLDQGVFAGLAGVVVFVPQIALLFLFLALLEDSGYLARAAFLMDRALRKVGLHGKSFIPMLSSFACAIPGIMAARTIESKRERLATIFVAPFMSCSARLPVYGLLITAFFTGQGPMIMGLILLGCYIFGILAAVGVALLFKLSSRREASTPFMLELPTYKMPQASLVAWQVWNGVKAFLTKAGTVIFALSIVLWALAYYPRPTDAVSATGADRAEANWIAQGEPLPPGLDDESSRDDRLATVRADGEQQAASEYSVAGRIGHAIEPAIAPLGFDWKIGVGLFGAFAAREVFNSYLGIIYSVGDPEAQESDDDKSRASERLMTAMANDRRADGTAVWRPLVAISLLAWFVIAMQCISTTAVVKRETGGWTWPLIQLVSFNLLAWVVCFLIYRVGTWLGF